MEEAHRAGTASMRNQLAELGKIIPDEATKREWAEMSVGYCTLFDKYLKTKFDTVKWSAIEPPPAEFLRPYDRLNECNGEEIHALAQKLVVVKLNGGLGTSMGCKGPKSVIEVRQHQTFLDLTVKQLEHLSRTCGTPVPLVLMNSFNTHSDTLKIVGKYKDMEWVRIDQFNQSKFPRMVQDSGLPLLSNYNGSEEDWYPPGHGDFYASFVRSGLLDKYIEEGREWVFLSNIDNLAATVDFKILKHMVESGADFVMEVTDKTRADVKGGTLIKYEDTPLKLLEIAQVPKEHVPDFTSIKKFKIFNTNNLWVNLKALKEVLRVDNFQKIDIIPNPKVVRGVRVLQLETAAGAAIACFPKPLGINVPRNRFLPVKSTSDLFVIQSDMFSLSHGALKMSSLRPFPTPPVVKLGNYFKNVADYLNRLGGRPNIIELDQLTISGDVTLGRGVVLKGTVIIVATDGNRIDIPDGTILEDQVVTGHLRIVPH
eukprot:TRINITY_DN1104_c0_g2_i2.p1 TRINITY_DN1104_c0_g2~~TRINITY_DN1104_c0_g2_i2.p1  ORF type:complete len:531 (-),score=115.22 TRINITY_DN1104_c0_g2_i2:135-1586(-)